MHQRSSFSPSRKIDFKSSFMNSPDQSFSNLSERCKFENLRHSAASSKYMASKSSFKNTSDTSSLTNLNSIPNNNTAYKSSLSNSSNFNSNSSLPQSPTIEEPFSPRPHLADTLGDMNRNEFNKNEFSNAGDYSANKQNIFSSNNIKHVSYSISSTGSNNKICQINNKISNRILNRNSSLNETNNSMINTSNLLDPIDLQFEALHMASKNANFENREQNESPNPIVANAFTKIGTKMTNLVEQYKDNLGNQSEPKSSNHIDQEVNILNGMHYLLNRSQCIPYYGIDLINNLGKILCNLGALDHIIKNFSKSEPQISNQQNQQNLEQTIKSNLQRPASNLGI